MKNLLFTLVLVLGLVQIVSAQELICKNSPTGSKIIFLEQTGKIIKLNVNWDEGAGFNGRINLDIENGVCTDCPQFGGIDGRFPRNATYEIEQTNPSEPVIIRWASPAPERYCGSGSITIGIPPTITSPTGQIWMDRNLGASQAATSYSDVAAYGNLYQWGRGSDGHELRNSNTTKQLSSTDQPGHGNFIITDDSWTSYDWRSTTNNNLWQGGTGDNNPCPTGFRVPTEEEWIAERDSWSSGDSSGAFASPLKLPMAGYRERDGIISDKNGNYWTTTLSGIKKSLGFVVSSGSSRNSYNRANGLSVRCIKD